MGRPRGGVEAGGAVGSHRGSRQGCPWLTSQRHLVIIWLTELPPGDLVARLCFFLPICCSAGKCLGSERFSKNHKKRKRSHFSRGRGRWGSLRREKPRVLRRLIKCSSSRKMFMDGEPELVGLEGHPVPGMKAGCWGQDGRSCSRPEVSNRKGGSLGIAAPHISSVERTGCLHVPSLQAQQGGGRRVRGWQCPGSGEICIALYVQRLFQRVVDRWCWRRWDSQEPYSAGLVLREAWSIPHERMLERCRLGGCPKGSKPPSPTAGIPRSLG